MADDYVNHMGVCPVHRVGMKKARIIYGEICPGAYEKEVQAGEVILGGCCEGELGAFGYVCPVDQNWYVLKDGQLVRYEDI